MRADGRIPDSDALDARLEKRVRGWVPAVEAALVRHIEPARAARLALRHAATFPAPYRSMNDAEEAAEDILRLAALARSEEHTSELQSLMRISYAVFCLKKKKQKTHTISAHKIYTNTDNIYKKKIDREKVRTNA